MPTEKKRKYFQDPLFEEFRSDTCYVCCRKIDAGQGIGVGQGLWRHTDCKPGSRRWSASDVDGRLAKIESPG